MTNTAETVASGIAIDDSNSGNGGTADLRQQERARLLTSIDNKSSSPERNHCSNSSTMIDDNIVIQLNRIQRQMVQINDYIKYKEENKLIQLEWEWVAAVLDRLLLILFTSIALSATIIICFVGMYVRQNV